MSENRVRSAIGFLALMLTPAAIPQATQEKSFDLADTFIKVEQNGKTVMLTDDTQHAALRNDGQKMILQIASDGGPATCIVSEDDKSFHIVYKRAGNTVLTEPDATAAKPHTSDKLDKVFLFTRINVGERPEDHGLATPLVRVVRDAEIECSTKTRAGVAEIDKTQIGPAKWRYAGEVPAGMLIQ